jgi:hypothetical protein
VGGRGGLERPFMAGMDSERGKERVDGGPGRARGEVRAWGMRWLLSSAARQGPMGASGVKRRH